MKKLAPIIFGDETSRMEWHNDDHGEIDAPWICLQISIWLGESIGSIWGGGGSIWLILIDPPPPLKLRGGGGINLI